MSAAALSVARANTQALGVGIALRQGDWYAALGAEVFDLLLSNPPYVAADDPALDALRYEPRAALTPGRDALQSLRMLVARRRGATCSPAAGCCSSTARPRARRCAAEACSRSRGSVYVRSHRDLAGHERITEGRHDQI